MNSFINKFLEKMTLVMRTSYALHKPTRVQIEPTNKCNLNCPQCGRKSIDREKNVGNLNKEEFYNIIKQFPEIKYIDLYGLGEPLISPIFFDMVKKLKERGAKISVTSNATIISDSVADNIIYNNIDDFNISVDGAKKESYEKLRIGAKFENVLNNIKKISNKRNDKNKKYPILSISMVLTKYNIDELLDYIRMGKSLGVDVVHIQDLNSIWSTTNFEIEDKNILKKKVSDAIEEAKKVNIIFTYGSKYNELRGYERKNIKQRLYALLIHSFDIFLRLKLPLNPISQCAYPWLQPYVTWDGYITPCCMLPDRKTINFGNLKEKKFNEIWNGKDYKKFRKAHAIGRYPNVCKECILLRDLVMIRI